LLHSFLVKPELSIVPLSLNFNWIAKFTLAHNYVYAETKNANSIKWIEQITFKRSIEIRNKSQIKIEKIKAVGA